MGTIVVLFAFLLAASANPIEKSFQISSAENSNTIGQDESHSSPDAGTSDAAVVSGDGDTGAENEEQTLSSAESPVTGVDNSPKQDEEQGTSNADFPLTGEDGSPKQDGEPVSHSDTPPVSTGDAASSKTGDDVSLSISTATTVSTEPSTEGNDTDGSQRAHTLSGPTLSTNSTNGSTDIEPPTTNVTQPPDGDPEDCRAADPTKHVYLMCQFMCNGDMMVLAKDNSTCLLGGETPSTIPTVLQDRRIPENATIGVCDGGNCIERGVKTTTPVALS